MYLLPLVHRLLRQRRQDCQSHADRWLCILVDCCSFQMQLHHLTGQVAGCTALARETCGSKEAQHVDMTKLQGGYRDFLWGLERAASTQLGLRSGVLWWSPQAARPQMIAHMSSPLPSVACTLSKAARPNGSAPSATILCSPEPRRPAELCRPAPSSQAAPPKPPAALPGASIAPSGTGALSACLM